MGNATDGRLSTTERREIYFLDFAKEIGQAAKMPLMVTGGITKRETAQMALSDACVDMIGIARSMAYHPDLPRQWQQDDLPVATIALANFKDKTLSGLSTMAMTKENLYRLGDGRPPKAAPRPLISLIKQQRRQKKQTQRYRAWLSAKGYALEPQ